MPIGKLHKIKRGKNLLILAIIFGAIALIWAITMIKMS